MPFLSYTIHCAEFCYEVDNNMSSLLTFAVVVVQQYLMSVQFVAVTIWYQYVIDGQGQLHITWPR